MAIEQIVIQIIYGLIFGAIAAGVGYLKQETPGAWDFAKFVKTLIIGGITMGLIGGAGVNIPGLSSSIASMSVQYGVALTALEVESLITFGIVLIADQLVKIIVRRTELVNLWNKIKEIVQQYFPSLVTTKKKVVCK